MAALIGALLMGRRAEELELTPLKAACEIGLCGALGWAVQGGLVYRGWHDTQAILVVASFIGSTGSRGVVKVSSLLTSVAENALKGKNDAE